MPLRILLTAFCFLGALLGFGVAAWIVVDAWGTPFFGLSLFFALLNVPFGGLCLVLAWFWWTAWWRVR